MRWSKEPEKLWTEKELEILKSFYHSASKEEILKYLPKRSWEAIKTMAAKLGVKRERRIIYNELAKKLKGKTRPKQVRDKISRSVKSWIVEHGNPIEGKHHLIETRNKIRQKTIERYQRGWKHPSEGKSKYEIDKALLQKLYLKRGLSTSQIARTLGCDHTLVLYWLKKYGIPTRSRGNPKGFVNRYIKTLIKSPEGRLRLLQRILKKCGIRPTKLELKIIQLIERQKFPFKYTGDGKIRIKSRIPDFIGINRKQVIEVFGDYWHNPYLNPNIKEGRTEKETVEYYRRYSYDCLVIWEHELDDVEKISDKIRAFSNGLTLEMIE